MKLYVAQRTSKNFYVLLNTMMATAERSLLSTGDSNATFSWSSLQSFLYLPTGNIYWGSPRQSWTESRTAHGSPLVSSAGTCWIGTILWRTENHWGLLPGTSADRLLLNDPRTPRKLTPSSQQHRESHVLWVINYNHHIWNMIFPNTLLPSISKHFSRLQKKRLFPLLKLR